MKKIGLLLAILGTSCTLMAQENSTAASFNSNKVIPKETKIVKPSRDMVMFQFSYDSWNKTPDSVHITGFGRGVGAYLCYDFPISKSNFSFAAGIGIGSSNIYLNKQRAIMNTTATGLSIVDIDTSIDDNYKRNKLSFTYLEAPFELRIYGNKENRNKGFKFAIGMKVGLLVNAHTKDRHNLAGPNINEKVVTNRYVQKWRFAPTARIGWGNFSIYGSYNMTQLFNANQGPEVYPFSLGICISGL